MTVGGGGECANELRETQGSARLCHLGYRVAKTGRDADGRAHGLPVFIYTEDAGYLLVLETDLRAAVTAEIAGIYDLAAANLLQEAHGPRL